jgi:hypothetical protein
LREDLYQAIMVANGHETYCAFSPLGFDEVMNVDCGVQNDWGIARARPPKFSKHLKEWRPQVEFHTLPCRKHDGTNIDQGMFCMHACRYPPRNNHHP